MESEWLKRALIRKGISGDTNQSMSHKAFYDESIKKFTLQKENKIIGTFDTIKAVITEIEAIN